MNEVFVIDFSKQIQASTKTTCDSPKCGKELGGHYSDKPNSLSLHLKDGEDEGGYPKYKTVHACSEEHMLEVLQDRAKTKKK